MLSMHIHGTAVRGHYLRNAWLSCHIAWLAWHTGTMSIRCRYCHSPYSLTMICGSCGQGLVGVELVWPSSIGEC